MRRLRWRSSQQLAAHLGWRARETCSNWCFCISLRVVGCCQVRHQLREPACRTGHLHGSGVPCAPGGQASYRRSTAYVNLWGCNTHEQSTPGAAVEVNAEPRARPRHKAAPVKFGCTIVTAITVSNEWDSLGSLHRGLATCKRQRVIYGLVKPSTTGCISSGSRSRRGCEGHGA